MSLKRVYATVSGDAVLVENRTTFRKLQREGSFAKLDFKPQPGKLYTRVRAISARVNRNYDGFTSAELKLAYKTFINRPVFVNHSNSDHTRTRGIILDSEYHEAGDDKYIELFIEVDAKAYPLLAKEIIEGSLDSVSMGCDVEMSVCSFCENVARTPDEFCDHVLYSKGQILQRQATSGEVENILVYEECRGINFFEISFVFDPADETALTQEVIVPRLAKAAGWDTGLGGTDIENFTAEELISVEIEVNTLASQFGMTPEVDALMRRYHELSDQLRAMNPDNPALFSEGALKVKSYNDVVAPAQVDTLREETLCPECGDDDFDGIECQWCTYTTPPDQLKDPDVGKAKEVDVRQDQDSDDDAAEDDHDDSDVDDEAQEQGEEEEMAEKKRKPSLGSALAIRRLQMAQQRIADLSVNEQPHDEEEQLVGTPAPEAGISTEQVMGEGTDEDVTNLDQGPVPVNLGPDETTDVTKLDRAIARRRAARRRKRTAGELTEGDGDGQGQDGEGFEGSDVAVREPDAVVDVTAPVANTTDDRAQGSQYDASDYDDQGAAVEKPDLTTDQNWVPPHKSNKTSAMKAMILVDAYLEHGLIEVASKFKSFAEFESLTEATVDDRLALLAMVAKAKPTTASVRPRAAVPRTASRAPMRGMPAMGTRPQSREAGNDQSDTTLLFV